MKVTEQLGKRTLIQKERKLGGCSKQRVHCSSLAESLAGKKRSLSSCLLGSAMVPEHDSSLFQAPGLYLIEVSVYECLTHPTLKRI